MAKFRQWLRHGRWRSILFLCVFFRVSQSVFALLSDLHDGRTVNVGALVGRTLFDAGVFGALMWFYRFVRNDTDDR